MGATGGGGGLLTGAVAAVELRVVQGEEGVAEEGGEEGEEGDDAVAVRARHLRAARHQLQQRRLLPVTTPTQPLTHSTTHAKNSK